MKFARRAEGIKTARSVFKSAREDMRSKYQVFVAAAMMEYYCSKVRSHVYNVRGQRFCLSLYWGDTRCVLLVKNCGCRNLNPDRLHTSMADISDIGLSRNGIRTG